MRGVVEEGEVSVKPAPLGGLRVQAVLPEEGP